jgi:hypothetical protein
MEIFSLRSEKIHPIWMKIFSLRSGNIHPMG